jgi:hypothetical protein
LSAPLQLFLALEGAIGKGQIGAAAGYLGFNKGRNRTLLEPTSL